MKLDFALPEFTRIAWVSPRAREVWEPRIQAVSNAWLDIELESVRLNIREGALVFGLERINNFNLHPIEVAPNRFAVGRGRHELAIAYEARDDDKVGKLLGFPACCREFFDEVWGDGNSDTTWEMAGNPKSSHVEVSGPVECNILGRWLGVRLVPHLPCSFNCNETVARAYAFNIIWPAQELEWARQILSWPTQWSSLHGVAIITMPVLKIVTNTTAVTEEQVVDRDGDIYPIEGAKGTEFPFKTIHTLSVRRTNDYSDNGFISAKTQDAAHAVILQAVSKVMASKPIGKVLDLGCGNGRLLQKILSLAPWLVPCGVEQDRSRFEKASERLKAYSPHLYYGDINDHSVGKAPYWDAPYCLALVSVNRIRETEQADQLLTNLANACDSIIFYSYDTDEWPGLGVPGLTRLFNMEEHFSGVNTCALLVTCRRDNNG